MRFEQTYANALKNKENIQTDTDFQKQLKKKLDDTNKTNEKYAKDMETIKTGLKRIVTVTTNTQSKINEIESKLERMRLEAETRFMKIETKIEKTISKRRSRLHSL